MNGSECKGSVRANFLNYPHKSNVTEQLVLSYNEAVDVCQRARLHVIKPLIIKCDIDTLQSISDGSQLFVTAADNNMTLTETLLLNDISHPALLAVSI